MEPYNNTKAAGVWACAGVPVTAGVDSPSAADTRTVVAHQSRLPSENNQCAAQAVPRETAWSARDELRAGGVSATARGQSADPLPNGRCSEAADRHRGSGHSSPSFSLTQRRIAPGPTPWTRLNAFRNAASVSYPICSATAATETCGFRSARSARVSGQHQFAQGCQGPATALAMDQQDFWQRVQNRVVVALRDFEVAADHDRV